MKQRAVLSALSFWRPYAYFVVAIESFHCGNPADKIQPCKNHGLLLHVENEIFIEIYSVT